MVPKRDEGLCPILDLRPISRALSKHPIRMIMLQPRDLNVLSHISASQRLSEVWFRGHGVLVLLSPIWAGVSSAHFLEMHGCSSCLLGASGMHILYLDDWMILVHSHARDMLGSHIHTASSLVELCVNMQKSCPESVYNIKSRLGPGAMTYCRAPITIMIYIL